MDDNVNKIPGLVAGLKKSQKRWRELSAHPEFRHYLSELQKHIENENVRLVDCGAHDAPFKPGSKFTLAQWCDWAGRDPKSIESFDKFIHAIGVKLLTERQDRHLSQIMPESDDRVELAPGEKAEHLTPEDAPIGNDDCQFVFAPSGDGYIIEAFGESGHFSARGAKGFHDLFQLVHSPNTAIPMATLDANIVVSAKQDAVDPETLKLLESELREMRGELESSKGRPEEESLRREYEEHLRYVSRATNKDGKPRDINNNETTNRRTRIRNRMKSLWGDSKDRSTRESKPGALKAAMPETADHFSQSITVGDDSGSYIYRPSKIVSEWTKSRE